MSSTSKASTNAKKKGKNRSSSNKIQNKPTGKIGAASSSKKISDYEITEDNMEIYKAIQAKLDADKRAKAVSQNEGKLFLITTPVLIYTFF
jgi:hypothetical protein